MPSEKKKQRFGNQLSYPTEDQLLPHLSDHMKGHKDLTESDPNKNMTADVDGLSTKVPTNQELIQLADQFKADLPGVLADKIEEVRKFFLEDITPFMLGISNGIDDVRDILQIAFDEEADINPYVRQLLTYSSLAVKMKIIHHTAAYMNLDPAVKSAFLLAAVSAEVKGTQDDFQAILSQVLSIPHVPGAGKRSEVQLRQLHKAEGDRPHRGAAGPAPKPRGGKGR